MTGVTDPLAAYHSMLAAWTAQGASSRRRAEVIRRGDATWQQLFAEMSSCPHPVLWGLRQSAAEQAAAVLASRVSLEQAASIAENFLATHRAHLKALVEAFERDCAAHGEVSNVLAARMKELHLRGYTRDPAGSLAGAWLAVAGSAAIGGCLGGAIIDASGAAVMAAWGAALTATLIASLVTLVRVLHRQERETVLNASLAAIDWDYAAWRHQASMLQHRGSELNHALHQMGDAFRTLDEWRRTLGAGPVRFGPPWALWIAAGISWVAAVVGAIGGYTPLDLFAGSSKPTAGSGDRRPRPSQPPPQPRRQECYDNKNFGRHCKGDPCRPGEIGYHWNCDTQRRVRLKCENGRVSVDYCPGSCVPNPRSGTDDVCR